MDREKTKDEKGRKGEKEETRRQMSFMSFMDSPLRSTKGRTVKTVALPLAGVESRGVGPSPSVGMGPVYVVE